MARKQQKPRQRKAHCGQKRAQRFFGRTRIWTWETDREIGSTEQNAVAVARTIKGWEPLEPVVANAVTRHRNSWIVCVRALCWDGAGTEWVEEEVRIMQNQRLSEFNDLYHDLRAKVLQAQRYDQVVDVGWIAGTWWKDPKDEELTLVDLGASSKARQLLWRQVDHDYQEERKKELAAA